MNLLTREHILKTCTWEDNVLAELSVWSPFFGRQVLVCFFPKYASGKEITHKMVNCLNDFLNLPEAYLPKVKELLYSHCEMCFNLISYGHVEVQEGEEETEANRRVFGIYNEHEAYDKSNLSFINILEKNDIYSNRYTELLFYPEWEKEHGCSIILQNGIPIDWQESDPWMGKYEN